MRSATDLPPLDPELAEVIEADEQSPATGHNTSTVGSVVTRILKDRIESEGDPLANVLWVVKAEELEVAPGTIVQQALDQRKRVLVAARQYAAKCGAATTSQGHYLVAALLTVGDQLPLLERRIAAARIAAQEVAGPSLMGRRALWFGQVRMIVMSAGSDFIEARPILRGTARVIRPIRSFGLQYQSQLEMATFLPGVLIREALWALLAWLHGCNRRAFSLLGVELPTGLTSVLQTRNRLRVECLISLACFALAVLAMSAWIAPTHILGVAPLIPLDVSGEQEYVASSLLSSIGVLGAGPWVPWSLLAVAVPTWEQASRLRWSAQYGVGPISRLWLWGLNGLGAVTWPVEAVASRLGFLGVVARTLPVFLALRWAMGKLI